MGTLQKKLLESIGPSVGYAYIRLLHATMKIDYRNQDVLVEARRTAGGYVIVCWHSRFVMMPYGFIHPTIALASRHRDARMLAAILRKLGLEVAEGSSSAGGAQGIRQILRRVSQGFTVAITPDGPRGPRRRAKGGAVTTARIGGLPLIPVAFSARPARRLASWDRTLLPFPFARGLFVYGDPIYVQRDADETQQETVRVRIETELDRVTDEADRAVGLGIEDVRPPVEAR